MDKYKVVIVDDDDVALENLSFELWKDARFSLEGTARNGRKGKKLIMKVLLPEWICTCTDRNLWKKLLNL